MPSRSLRSASLLSLASLAGSLALACGHKEPTPDAPGAADYYRSRLADSPKGSRATEYRDALESAEFAEAQAKGTVLGFRTFLSEFPDGPHQRQARTLLEALRWNDAVADGSEGALQGFLADEPKGAHADEAWSRIAELQLRAALASQSAPQLRAWLAAHPNAAGRDRAAAALAAADFRAATGAPLHLRRALLRSYLSEHPDGAQRGEAESLEASASVEEAALLGDELELRAWVRAGSAEAKRALAGLALADAASRLDAGELAELARGADSPEARRAAKLLASLHKLGGRAKDASAQARALRLPSAHDSASERPSAPRERARALRDAALSLDGRELAPLLSEMSAASPWVAEAALESALYLARSLPAEEARVRAARAAAALQPIAQDGPHLAALAIALYAQGDGAAALAQARAAAARDPRSLIALIVAAKLEAEQGELPLTLVSSRALARAAHNALDARAGGAPLATLSPAGAGGTEGEEAPTLWSLCAAEQAARAAEALLGFASSGSAEQESERRRATDEAAAVVTNSARAVAAAERAVHREGACAAESALWAAEVSRREEQRARAAAALKKLGDLSAEALARARERDPGAQVRAVLGAPAWTEATPPVLRAATVAP